MSTQTSFLNLILPANNEYQNDWEIPVNQNSQAIDNWASGINTEVVAARNGQPSIAAFLAKSINSDGTPVPTPELTNARGSFIYGDETSSYQFTVTSANAVTGATYTNNGALFTVSGTIVGRTTLTAKAAGAPTGTGTLTLVSGVGDATITFSAFTSTAPVSFDLPTRLKHLDMDLFNARGGAVGLRDHQAIRSGSQSMVLQGTVDGSGAPTWLGKTGAIITFDGHVTNILMLISGYFARIRTAQTLTISGGAGTKYLYALYNASGVITVDGSGATNGVVGSDSTKLRLFQDSTTNFSTSNVQLGDTLVVLGSSLNAGQYQVRVVAPAAVANNLQIYGVFPASVAFPTGEALSALAYTISDPFAATLGFDTAKTPTSGKFYLGEADFDGTSVTAVRPICHKDYFIGVWTSVAVAPSTGTFAVTWNHYLFDDALQVTVEVSQANSGSPVEVLNPIFYKIQWTTTQISVQNASLGTFYTDYGGTARLTGYMRVVVTKKRV